MQPGCTGQRGPGMCAPCRPRHGSPQTGSGRCPSAAQEHQGPSPACPAAPGGEGCCHAGLSVCTARSPLSWTELAAQTVAALAVSLDNAAARSVASYLSTCLPGEACAKLRAPGLISQGAVPSPPEGRVRARALCFSPANKQRKTKENKERQRISISCHIQAF